MLIDELMPKFDAVRTEHLLVEMPIEPGLGCDA